MSLKRWDARRDANEKPMVDAAEQAGARVLRLDTFDLLIWYRGKLFMRDAKTANGKPTKAQQKLIDEGWPLVFVKDEMALLRSIGAVPGGDGSTGRVHARMKRKFLSSL